MPGLKSGYMKVKDGSEDRNFKTFDLSLGAIPDNLELKDGTFTSLCFQYSKRKGGLEELTTKIKGLRRHLPILLVGIQHEWTVHVIYRCVKPSLSIQKLDHQIIVTPNRLNGVYLNGLPTQGKIVPTDGSTLSFKEISESIAEWEMNGHPWLPMAATSKVLLQETMTGVGIAKDVAGAFSQ